MDVGQVEKNYGSYQDSANIRTCKSFGSKAGQGTSHVVQLTHNFPATSPQACESSCSATKSNNR